jgi:hypothetical protein
VLPGSELLRSCADLRRSRGLRSDLLRSRRRRADLLRSRGLRSDLLRPGRPDLLLAVVLLQHGLLRQSEEVPQEPVRRLGQQDARPVRQEEQGLLQQLRSELLRSGRSQLLRSGRSQLLCAELRRPGGLLPLIASCLVTPRVVQHTSLWAKPGT